MILLYDEIESRLIEAVGREPWRSSCDIAVTCDYANRGSSKYFLTSQFWAQDNPHAILERGFQVRISVWADIVRNIVVGPYLLPDGPTAQRYSFLATVLPGLL
jgi:hypothetical protein